MIDTHAHLQFKAFEGKVGRVIKSAQDAGVEKIVVVGTNLETSKKAVDLAEKYEGIYASVGIHPHHVFGIKNLESGIMEELGIMLSYPKVVAVGETGLDRYVYKNTSYQSYQITDEFIELQKLFFREQIKLAVKYQKSLIIHNRGTVPELLEILETNWNPFLEGRSVFHCCEPDPRLLDFAIKHNIFIGIDGDITYDQAKQNFVKKVPLELIVLETDSPYFVPEPLRHSREGGNPTFRKANRQAPLIINEPKNLTIIAEFISRLKNEPIENVREMSSKNSSNLFKL